MRVSPQALREDAGRLYGRRVVEVFDDRYRRDGVAPGPAATTRVILGLPDHLGYPENRLPNGRVENRPVAGRDGRPLRRPLRPDVGWVDLAIEGTLPAPPDEQPVRQTCATADRTLGISMPKVSH